MVLILNGNSEIGPHVMSNLRYLNCSRHLIRSRAATNVRKDRYSFMRAVMFWEIPANISTMISMSVSLPDCQRIWELIISKKISFTLDISPIYHKKYNNNLTKITNYVRIDQNYILRICNAHVYLCIWSQSIIVCAIRLIITLSMKTSNIK